jgi:hypothetical protein
VHALNAVTLADLDQADLADNVAASHNGENRLFAVRRHVGYLQDTVDNGITSLRRRTLGKQCLTGLEGNAARQPDETIQRGTIQPLE